MLLGCGMPARAAGATREEAALGETAAYVCAAVPDPQVGSIGGEWAVLGLVRSGYDFPEDYVQDYYDNIQAYVAACGGVLHARKYTEYSRLVLALTAIGKDPTNVAGYDLLMPLGDFDKTVWQGINGPVWALIALDSGGYEVPVNSGAVTQATRELYVDNILSRQLIGGGFALGGTEADASVTAMALQALAKYTDRSDVSAAVEKALACLSALQDEKGGFSAGGAEDSESCSQAIIALCALGIPLTDGRFVKDGNTLLDNLLSFRTDGGGFKHITGGGTDQMATEQALLALAAVHRLSLGLGGLYDLTDRIRTGTLSGDALCGGGRRSLIFYYRKNKPVWVIAP